MAKAYLYLRVSKKDQVQGHGIERQHALLTAYAEQHGLTVQDDQIFSDLGVSAFRGANAEEGNLAKLLKLIESGQIERGSYLLIESLDRLSRQKIGNSLDIFQRIIKAGIWIVTVADGKAVNPDDTVSYDYIYSLIAMERSHEQSRITSHRNSEVWDKKRKCARTEKKPITSWTPAWVRIERNVFVIDQQKADVVKGIFRDCIGGMGCDVIARRLNDKEIPAFTGRRGWHASVVRRILRNRSVLGEFQPHTKTDGKRQRVGEPILGYFPAIISQATFYQADMSLASRRVSNGGRKGESLSNLFSHIAVCGYCGGKMRYRNPGKKGVPSLVCEAGYRKFDCRALPWRYRDFEETILSHCDSLDMASMLSPQQQDARQIEALERSIESKAKVHDLEAKASNLADAIANHPLSSLISKLQKVEELLTQARLDEIESSNDFQVARADRIASQNREGFSELLAKIRDPQQDLFAIRSKLAHRLKEIVGTIQVFPAGRLVDEKEMETLISARVREEGPAAGRALRDRLNPGLRDKEAHRFVIIEYADDRATLLQPAKGDPRQIADIVESCPMDLEETYD